MLDFPLWKKLAVLLVCLAGLLVAMPNAFYGRVERANDARLALEQGAPETPELAAARDGWPSFLPSGLVSLGLDPPLSCCVFSL
jgi:preprotein translocase subunit SecD